MPSRALRDNKDSGFPDMRMMECGHRWHRFSDLRGLCLDCERDGESNSASDVDGDDIEARLGTQAMYRWQEGMGQ